MTVSHRVTYIALRLALEPLGSLDLLGKLMSAILTFVESHFAFRVLLADNAKQLRGLCAFRAGWNEIVVRNRMIHRHRKLVTAADVPVTETGPSL